jgi:hypothetical protein
VARGQRAASYLAVSRPNLDSKAKLEKDEQRCGNRPRGQGDVSSVLPTFIGGVTLSGLADRLPRRQVMIGADLTSGAIVACMMVPGVPLAVLIVLLFAVTMIGALFLAARAATYGHSKSPYSTMVTWASVGPRMWSRSRSTGTTRSVTASDVPSSARSRSLGGSSSIVRNTSQVRPGAARTRGRGTSR